MKETGIVRRVDDLGRIVIPKEIRRKFGIRADDPMEIFTTKDGIVIQRYRDGCFCCGGEDNLVRNNGIVLCPSCIQKFQSEASREEG